MCLTKQGSIRKATKPILVYKHLQVKKENGVTSFVSPYQETKVKLGKTLQARGRDGKFLKRLDRTGYTIYHGIHAYITNAASPDTDEVSVMAVIPPGTEYCLGSHYDIVATKMFVTTNIVKVEGDYLSVLKAAKSLPKKISKHIK